MGFNTSLIHGAPGGDRHTGATLTPIYQVSAFAYDSAEKLEQVFSGRAPGFAYTRIGNPTVDAFEKRIADLEGGVGAVACASGMAAVTMTLLTMLRSGDEVVAGAGLFGGTIDLFGDLEALGIKIRYADRVDPETVESLITDRTRAVFAELISNPKLTVVDVEAVSKVCHERGVPLIIDSTTATPYLARPLALGADIVVHSGSKYINGGGNSLSGIIVDGGTFRFDPERYPGLSEYKKFGPRAFLAKLRNGIWRNSGACLSPFNAYMDQVGIETLGLRMERLCSNALALAKALQELGLEVRYPALPDDPDYPLVERQLGGKGGAILTVRAGSRERAFRLINSLKYALIATNIGDVRTLVIHPASTIYLHSTPEQRESAGVFDDTIRISIGIEDPEDLIEDLRQAYFESGKEN
ncbi:MAG: O-acetylhomoserine aminocarboxypropyltransferase/cysteine synthase [Ruminococcus sp.]|nr:O-acetylhomoserine aminocarboxypropyltransferase/cysteine synthase [Ruminococcus sp.]